MSSAVVGFGGPDENVHCMTSSALIIAYATIHHNIDFRNDARVVNVVEISSSLVQYSTLQRRW